MGVTSQSFSFLLSYPEFLLAAVCFLAISSLCRSRAARRRRRHAVPVPVIWPVVGMLPFVVANLGHLLDAAAGALRELGCTFMFRGPWLVGGADFLVTCDPAVLHHCLVANHANYDKGHDFAEMFDVVGDGLLVADAASWAPQRHLAASVFSSTAFRSYVIATVVRQARRLLVPFLEHVAGGVGGEGGGVVEMEEVFMRYSLDVSYAVAFAADINSLSVANAAAPFPAFGEATRVAGEAVLFRHIAPARLWKLMRWLNVGVERRLADAKAVLDEFVYREIANRKKYSPRTPPLAAGGHDLLSMYMASPRDAAMTDEQRDRSLRDAAVGFMFAAKDLIAAALTWLFYMLATHPHVEAKILAELTSLHHHHAGAGDDDAVVFDGEALRSATYLHAAVLETLRLYPPAPFEEKEATGDDELPGGTAVRKGTRVVFSLYAMGRVEGIWGGDCREFRPERWLTAGKVRHEPSYKFAAFNAGPRSCLGRDLGITNIKIAAATIVYNFRVELAAGHVVEPKDSVVLHTKNGLMVRVKRREEAA